MFEVKNGQRVIRFEGSLLASSSSRRGDSSRWIEFRLYKTAGSSYILSRIGVSHVFHDATCLLVTRYGLHEAHVSSLKDYSTPCEECLPDSDDPIIYPEEIRYWTLVADDAVAVVDALHKRDINGGRYLTNVAERLLTDASRVDSDIDMAFKFQFID